MRREDAVSTPPPGERDQGEAAQRRHEDDPAEGAGSIGEIIKAKNGGALPPDLLTTPSAEHEDHDRGKRASESQRPSIVDRLVLTLQDGPIDDTRAALRKAQAWAEELQQIKNQEASGPLDDKRAKRKAYLEQAFVRLEPVVDVADRRVEAAEPDSKSGTVRTATHGEPPGPEGTSVGRKRVAGFRRVPVEGNTGDGGQHDKPETPVASRTREEPKKGLEAILSDPNAPEEDRIRAARKVKSMEEELAALNAEGTLDEEKAARKTVLESRLERLKPLAAQVRLPRAGIRPSVLEDNARSETAPSGLDKDEEARAKARTKQEKTGTAATPAPVETGQDYRTGAEYQAMLAQYQKETSDPGAAAKRADEEFFRLHPDVAERVYGLGAESMARAKAEDAAKTTAEVPKTSEAPKLPPAERPKYRIGIVNVDAKIDEIARHRAEERLHAFLAADNAPEKERKGKLERFVKAIPNVFRKAWRHMGEDAYRVKFIAEEKKKLGEQISALRSGKAGEDEQLTVAEKSASVERFLLDAENEIYTSRGEKRVVVGEQDNPLRKQLAAAIERYASGDRSETARAELLKVRDEVLHTARTQYGEILGEGTAFDNVLEVADQVAEQFRLAKEHGEKLASLDTQLDLTFAQARSGIREEGHIHAFDNIVGKLERSKYGRFVSPATVGFSLMLATRLLPGAVKYATAFTGVGLVLGAGAGAGLARERKKAEVTIDVADLRRRETMGYGTPQDAKRAERLGEFRFEQKEIGTLTTDIQTALAAFEADAANADPKIALQKMQDLASSIARAERLDELSIEHHHDLIKFNSPATIEQERLAFLKTIAEAKVKANALCTQNAPRFAETLQYTDTFGATVTKNKSAADQREGMSSGMLEKDERFAKFKKDEANRAMLYGGITGLAAGLVGEFGMDWVREHAFGAAHIDSTLERLVKGGRHLFGHHEAAAVVPGIEHAVTPPVEQHVSGPMNVKDWLEHQAQDVKHIARAHLPHFDSNTPDKPDFNEQDILPGGVHGTGIDENGHYVYSIAKMTADGSFTHDVSANAQELIKHGGVHMLVSATEGTQKIPIEIPVDAHGNVVIDPKSSAGKFFEVIGGKLNFKGRFLEVAQYLKNPDGTPMLNKAGEQMVRILATVKGHGVDTVFVDQLQHAAPSPIPIPEAPTPEPFTFPPTIPLSKRKPLEVLRKQSAEEEKKKVKASDGKEPASKEKKKKGGEKETAGVAELATAVAEAGAAVQEVRAALAEKKGKETTRTPLYEQQLSETLKKNPDAELNEQEEIARYLEKLQPPEYRPALENIVEQFGAPLSHEARMIIAIPAFREGKTIEHTLEEYVKQQKADGTPIDQNLYEIIIVVDQRPGYSETETVDAIDRFKEKHPEMHVHAVASPAPLEHSVNATRKSAHDIALTRAFKRGKGNGDLIIVNNDADAESIDPKYLSTILAKFDADPKVDAVIGRTDYSDEAYEHMPEEHLLRKMHDAQDLLLQQVRSPKGFTTNARNAAYRAGMYAATGGHIHGSESTDGSDVGKMVQEARMGTDRSPIAFLREARVVTSPRGMLTREHGKERSKDAAARMKELADAHATDLTNILGKAEKRPKATKERVQRELQTLWEEWKAEAKTKDAEKVFVRTMKERTNIDFGITKDVVEVVSVESGAAKRKVHHKERAAHQQHRRGKPAQPVEEQEREKQAA